MFLLKAIFWVMFLPFKILFKLLFWWLPTGDDYDSDEEWMFWRDKGHKF